MKKIILTALLAITGFLVHAQKLDKAKDLFSKKKYTEAKTEIDGVLAVDKNKTTSEPWYRKAEIYIAISKDSLLKSTVPDARAQAFDALKHYMELETKEKDSSKRNIALTLSNNQPFVDLYSGYSKDAASFYNAGNFNDALTNFKNCLEVFDFMSSKKLVNVKLDTTTTLYAGISAEKANKRDEAAIYYGKIAENKAKGEGFDQIYKWLADHYKQKGDIATSSKFVTLGREVYPSDTFWSGFELDMLRDKGAKDDLWKKYEEVIRQNPENHLYLFNYGVELYQAGYEQDLTKRPANSKELIEKARETLTKSLTLKPDYPNAHMVLGQISYNEGVDMNNENKLIKPATAGGRLTPEQTKRKEELRIGVVKKFDEAIPQFMKVDQLLDSQGKLKMDEKEILKNALDLMLIAFDEKKAQLEQKRNAAEVKKNAADMKQYDAELKTLQAEIDKYTDKYNGVDRKH